ncbi:MAG: hypothetical protein ACKO8Q_10515, partial [Bacteroidota bacterium]
MRKILVVIFLAPLLLVSCSILNTNFGKKAPNEEGFGVNKNSRKYFEYLRNRDPETGEVPPGIFS